MSYDTLAKSMLVVIVASLAAVFGAIVWRGVVAPIPNESRPQSCVVVIGDTAERYAATCNVTVRER